MLPNYSKLKSSFKEVKVEKPKTYTHIPPKNQRSETSSYDTFLYKCNYLEDYIDRFSTRELVMYFKKIAEECGYKYIISNIQKDMGVMKRVRENFSNREICAMIEFLYKSTQSYLRKDTLSPNLLVSQWVNTIYADTKLWVDDKYDVKESKSINYVTKREWKDNDTKDIKIGVWE